ncbi:unnamed protein product [Soboliphyme baturini]|uniref:Non-specific serine/threonine protein kinase n=1 Tax=Soboliphyme baturini TaxID=241478 RepID=A0A183J9Q3_9BILA|nr:unnamed protein product [Soboliphyme baturini]
MLDKVFFERYPILYHSMIGHFRKLPGFPRFRVDGDSAVTLTDLQLFALLFLLCRLHPLLEFHATSYATKHSYLDAFVPFVLEVLLTNRAEQLRSLCASALCSILPLWKIPDMVEHLSDLLMTSTIRQNAANGILHFVSIC